MDLAIVTGFGDKGADKLERSLNDAFRFNSSIIIPSTPWYRALKHPEAVIDLVEVKIDEMDSDELVLLGHSYGALIALAVVTCRRKIGRTLKTLGLINGPLRSDVTVLPAKMAHNIFYKHYDYREELAKYCEDGLQNVDRSKIFTVGPEFDGIVPPESHRLDGVRHLSLPAEFKGHGIKVEPLTAIVASEVRRQVLHAA